MQPESLRTSSRFGRLANGKDGDDDKNLSRRTESLIIGAGEE